ncbi:hypothetical protein AcV7_005325 [Taiwanofungus camphoratus]|nr:hypothetical protein AcV7_005325 [Antrodia cinnamomea]
MQSHQSFSRPFPRLRAHRELALIVEQASSGMSTAFPVRLPYYIVEPLHLLTFASGSLSFKHPDHSINRSFFAPMSSNASNAEFISILEAGETQSYCQSAISALVLYEYIITFGQEVQFIWGSGATGAIIIFYLNRCVMVGVGIMNALSIINWNANAVCCVDFTDRRCPHLLWVSEL